MKRTIESSKEPREDTLVSYSKDDVNDARLTCATETKCQTFKYGFTAEKTFFLIGSLQLFYLKFLHDQKKLLIKWKLKENETFEADLRYSSFQKLNLEIRHCYEGYHLRVTIVVYHFPFIYKWNVGKSGRARSIEIEEGLRQSTAFQFSFMLNGSEIRSFLKQLYSLGCPLTFEAYQHNLYEATPFSPFTFLTKFQRTEAILFVMETLKLRGTIGLYFLRSYFLRNKEHIKNLGRKSLLALLIDMVNHLNKDLSLSTLNVKHEYRSWYPENDRDYVKMKTLIVTPTRSMLLLEDYTMSCRAYRIFDHTKMILIKFCDEDGQKFPSFCVDDVAARKYRDGITLIGKTYHDLICSQSAVRDNGAVFYQTNDKNEIPKMWAKLGTFQPDTAAKVYARLGLLSTSARNLGCQLYLRNVAIIPDYEYSNACDPTQKKYCFSDGIGVMSILMAQQLRRLLELDSPPSAVQFRFGPFKGMLSIDIPGYHDGLIDNSEGKYFAYFRDSQKKFILNSEALQDFEVVSYSCPAQAYLHRPAIAMWDSLAKLNGKQEAVRSRIMDLCSLTMNHLLEVLMDNDAFLECLGTLPQYVPTFKLKNKNLFHEPFQRSMVEAKVVMSAKLLANKATIPLNIDEARTALGVVDITGKLKPGQVFFRHSKTLKAGKGEPVVMTGLVAITKSPIYHAGDIQFMEAVDVPEIPKSWIDVIVFPNHGPRPHPDELGGGDLDGDQYMIVKDPELVLAKNAMPSDFLPPNNSHLKKVNLNSLQAEVPAMRATYMKENNLDYLSVIHLAHMPLMDSRSQEMEGLAKKADDAVNFAKSGVAPKSIEASEKHFSWPDFMDKRHEVRFTTDHILSSLFKVTSTFFMLMKLGKQEAEKLRSRERQGDSLEMVTVYRHYGEYENEFKAYKAEVEALMATYQIKSEGELFSNEILEPTGLLNSSKSPYEMKNPEEAILQRKVNAIVKKYRRMYLTQLSDTWEREMNDLKENVLTYQLPLEEGMERYRKALEYAEVYQKLAEDYQCCYSFPWIAWEGLDALKSLNQDRQDPPTFETKIVAESIAKISNLPFGNTFKIWRMWDKWKKIHGFYADYQKLVPLAFLLQLKKYDEKPRETSGEAFKELLVEILKSNEPISELPNIKTAIQALFIKHAFLPNEPLLSGTNLLDVVIDYPYFTIEVPIEWAQDFYKQYHRTFLKLTGCDEIDINWQKTHYGFERFSLMSRGSLQACQKLESLLTPAIPYVEGSTMLKVRESKKDASNNLLMKIFGFRELLHRSASTPSNKGRERRNYPRNSLKHASTVPTINENPGRCQNYRRPWFY